MKPQVINPDSSPPNNVLLGRSVTFRECSKAHLAPIVCVCVCVCVMCVRARTRVCVMEHNFSNYIDGSYVSLI